MKKTTNKSKYYSCVKLNNTKFGSTEKTVNLDQHFIVPLV